MVRITLISILFMQFALAVQAQQWQFESFTSNDGLSNNYVEHIVQDRSGYLWVATRMGLNCYNGTEFKHFFQNTSDSTSLPFNNVLSLFIDGDDRLWLGSYGSQIALFDKNTQQFHSYAFEHTPNARDLDVGQIFLNAQNIICANTSNGVYCLKNGVFVKSQNTVAPRVRVDSVQFRQQQWLATKDGIKLRAANGATRWFTMQNTPELHSNSIKILYKDRDNNLWCGTHGGGLVKVHLQTEPLRLFSSKNCAIRNNITTAFYEDAAGHYWIASDGGGIAVLNRDFQLLKQIDVPSSPQNNSVLDFAADAYGQLWVASWQTGLFSVDTKNYRTQSLQKAFEKSGLSNDIKAVAVLGDTVFCGTYGNGLVLVNRKTASVSHRKQLQIPNYINDIMVDKNGLVWIASTRGLFTYKNGKLSERTITAEANQNGGIKMVWSVREASNNRILLATSAKPFIINQTSGETTELELGLRSPFDVKCMFEDRNKQLWVTAYDDLFMINQQGAVASIKLTQIDFPIDIFSAGAVLQTSDNTMLLGAQEGFFAFRPDSLNLSAAAPAIMFESFARKYVPQIPGQSSILQKHINSCDKIELQYDDFPVSLSFASVNYSKQTAIRFSFKLETIDTAWLPVTGKNELVFHQLKPGEYTLKLRNTNKYGRWSESYRSLKIVVRPPFWQTWWFRLLFMLVVVGVILALYQTRVRRLRYQKMWLTKEVARQTQTLRLQNEEINEQKKKLETQADQLQEKLLELHDQKEDLEALNSELSEQSEALQSSNSQLVSVIDSKNKLLSIIAHDIKNPFNVVLLASQSLLDASKDEVSKNVRMKSEMIHSASKNVFTILSNLLDWALAQSGLLTSNPSNFAMNAFLSDMLASCRELTAHKNIRVALTCPEALWCFADEQMMRIVIRNLFQNSVKFTPEGGLISILCSEDGGELKLEIIDTGIGMDAATIEKLFEVNSVISEKGTRDEEGRGLGLLVVKEFLDKNKGRIAVSSKKNKGSNFTLWIPRGESAESSRMEAQATSEPVVQKMTKNAETTILLVDDNAKLLDQLSKNLSEHFSVHACSSAHEAVAFCKTAKVDLVISDIVMGEIDGITLCKTIKSDLKLNIPVVLITGIDSSEIQADAYNTGADAFIKKPFEFNVLLARVQNLLKQRHDTTKGFKLQTKLKPQDEVFVDRLKEEVERGIPDPDFSVEILAQTLGYSRVNLFRKAKKALGITPSEYIQHARLEVAASLLKEQKYRVAEVAYMVGFSDPQYFSNCFTKHYGVSPGEYKAKQR